MAPTASALAAPPPPTVTASVAAALAGDGAGAGAAAATALEVGGVSAGSASLGGSLATAGAQGAVVTGGLIVGTYLGQQTLKLLPGDWYTTTGSTWCDLQVLVKGDAACGHVAPAPDYVINSDLSLHAPGWAGTNQVTTQYSFGGSGPLVKWDVISAPGFGQNGAVQMRLTQTTASPGGPGSGIYNYYAQWRIVFRDGSVSAYALQNPPTRVYAASPVGSTLTTTVNVENSPFDHVEVKEYGASGQVVGSWYPEGHAQRPPDADPDPLRRLVASWTCSDGSTGSASSLAYHESDATWPEWPGASCAVGIVTHYEVSKVTENGPTTRLVTWDAPQVARDWAAARPDCTSGSCVLRLYRVDASTGSRIDCMTNAPACVDWYSDPAKADHYSCEYGGQAVALSECNVFRPTFNVLTGAPTVDNDGKAQPATEIGPYGDPKADGNPVPRPSSDPTPEQPEDGCPPPFSFTAGGIGYWVTKGVGCALTAAFVPSAGSVQAEVDATRTIVTTRPPFSMLAPIGGMLTGLVDGWSTGCTLLPDADPYHNGLRLPCDPPQSDWMTALRLLGTAAVVVGTGFAVWHMLVASIGGRQADS